MNKLILIALATCLCGCFADERTPEQVKAADDACKADVNCYGPENRVAAGIYCKDFIQKLGKYSFRWTDGALESKFSKVDWLNKDKATLSFFGDKIEFQNGFGAYQPAAYQCDFDPATNTVLGVRAAPGHV